jgi:hypothetical protein
VTNGLGVNDQLVGGAQEGCYLLRLCQINLCTAMIGGSSPGDFDSRRFGEFFKVFVSLCPMSARNIPHLLCEGSQRRVYRAGTA